MKIKELLQTNKVIDTKLAHSIYIISFMSWGDSPAPTSAMYLSGEYDVYMQDNEEDFGYYCRTNYKNIDQVIEEYQLFKDEYPENKITQDNDTVEWEKFGYIPAGTTVKVIKSKYGMPAILYKDIQIEFYNYTEIHKYIS